MKAGLIEMALFVALVACAAFFVRWVLADRAARRKALEDDDTGA